jgi:hypothetical protein
LTTGTVTVGPHDEHTPCDFNVDDTVVMFEHYNTGVGHHTFTDPKLNIPDYRVIVDVDASGHFEIPADFKHANTDSYQVTWARITHSDCANAQLGLEDLASVTHGPHVVVSQEQVFSGTVPAHVPPHYITCGGDPVAPVVPIEGFHRYDIAPIEDHGAFLLNITDNRFDGIHNTTELYSGGNLIQWSHDTFVPRVTTAVVGGHYPVHLPAEDYSVHSWGHDDLNIASDDIVFPFTTSGVDVTAGYIAPSASAIDVSGAAASPVAPTTIIETEAPAVELSATGSASEHIAPEAPAVELSATGSASEHIAPEAPAVDLLEAGTDCGCTSSLESTMSYEDILRLWQDYHKIVDIKIA